MFPLILVGFATITIGVALLFLGEVPFLAGKRISARRSRLIGIVLISFLPLALGVVQVMSRALPDYDVDGPIVTWSVLGFCLFVVGVILFRVVVPKRPRRKSAPEARAKASSPGAVRFVELELIDDPTLQEQPAPKKSSARKRGKPAAGEDNPFEFN